MKRWHLMDLVTDHKTGKLVEAKVWSNACKAAMTFGFVWAVVHAQGTDWLWLTFGAVCLGHDLGVRYQNKDAQKTGKEATQ